MSFLRQYVVCGMGIHVAMRFHIYCRSSCFLDMKDSMTNSTAIPSMQVGDLLVAAFSGVHQAKWAVPRGNVSSFHMRSMRSSFPYSSTQSIQSLRFQSNVWRLFLFCNLL